MGCPGEVDIGDNLTFSITTHDPTIGDLTDADSAPSYRLYEDETETPILTGTMAKLDDANTTGFYVETVACTVANGFEVGKTYSIYIAAAVNTITGGISYGFKVKNPDEAGAGGISWTLIVKDINNNAVSGTEVWVSSDLAGNNIVAGTKVTDANGQVTFMLDAGTYYRWADHTSYNFTNPQVFEVS